MGPKRLAASSAVTALSPRTNSLRVKRSCVTSGCGMAGPPATETPGRAARETLVDAGQLQLVGAVAAHEAAGGDLAPRRRLRAADVDRVRAARVEVAATRRRRR